MDLAVNQYAQVEMMEMEICIIPMIYLLVIDFWMLAIEIVLWIYSDRFSKEGGLPFGVNNTTALAELHQDAYNLNSVNKAVDAVLEFKLGQFVTAVLS